MESLLGNHSNNSNRQRQLTYIFHKLIKEVINLVTLLEKNDRKKSHVDISDKIVYGRLFIFDIPQHFCDLVFYLEINAKFRLYFCVKFNKSF